MKRALRFLLIFSVIALGSAAVLAAGARTAWKRAGRSAWPAGLGSLEEVPARFPKREPTAEALRLAELAKPLGIDFAKRSSQTNATENAIRTFVEAECARDVVAVGAPPKLVTALLTERAAAIDALRDHLRASRDLSWAVDLDKGFDAPQANLQAHLRVVRLLVARALVRARSGDAGAWDDLHAVSMLERSLERRPDVVSQVLALGFAQKVNAAAWKLPTPAPEWLAAEQSVDRRRLLLQGLQTDTWAMWRFAPEASTPYPRALMQASMASLVKLQRQTALDLSRVTACGFDGDAYTESRAAAIPRWNTMAQIAYVNLPWSRMLRYEAEREATANALRVRAGEALQERSRCSDGTWRQENGRIAFTGAIPPLRPDDMPLSLLTQR